MIRPSPDSAPQPPDSILTLADGAEAEFKEKRSRFIGLAYPAASERAASDLVASTGKRFHDARHVCWGWRLGVPPQVREGRNDDGEPTGTAGEPILVALRRHDLVDVLVIVVRYFGGIKLGTGGLARAYGQAAEDALCAAPVRKVPLGREFDLKFPYALTKTVRHVLDGAGGRVVDEKYGQDVAWRIWLAHSRWQAFAAHLTELTAGKIELLAVDPDA